MTVPVAQPLGRRDDLGIQLLRDAERAPELVDGVLIGRGHAPANRFVTDGDRSVPIGVAVAAGEGSSCRRPELDLIERAGHRAGGLELPA